MVSEKFSRFRMKNIYIILMIILLSSINSFSQTTSYKGHALLTFNLVKYTNWEDLEAGNSFVITVLGKSKVYADLEELVQKRTIEGKKVVIKQVEDVKDLDYFSHAIYLSDGKSNILNEVLKKTLNQTTLVVTERESLIKKGACVSILVLENGSLKFEVNKEALSGRNLKIAKELLSLAYNY